MMKDNNWEGTNMIRELVHRSRSVRGFTQRPVTREELESLIAIARETPSTSNVQPLKYYLSCTREDNEKIQPLTVWAGRLRELRLPKEGHCPTAFIVICFDSSIARDPSGFQRDVGIVAQTILLAARDMGLSGCMVGNFVPDRLFDVLGLPDALIPQLVIGLGEPDENIVLTTAKDNQVAYYRDEEGIHYVPKRPLSELIINPA